MKTTNRIAIAIVLLFMLVGVGTAGFHLIEGWPWFKCLYGTLMTVSTIGAEPENQLSDRGRVFNVVVMVLGLGLVGFTIGSFTHAVIQFELGSVFGRRRMEKEIVKLTGHFIICGAGRVGRRVATEIAARKIPLVLIEKDLERAQWAQQNNLPFIIGDASSESVLRQAHIERARGLATAVASDAENVYVVLTARGLAPDLQIVARASEEEAQSKMTKAGATVVVSPYSYAGQRIARVLTRPHVQRFIDLAFAPLNEGGLDLQIEEVFVAEKSKLENLSLAHLRVGFGIIVLAVRRKAGRLDFNPEPEETVSAGDFVVAMGDSRKIREFAGLADGEARV
ncbi:MAG: potassium channel family protein [Terriglobia bacterium]